MKEYRLRLGSREIPIRRTLQDAKPSTFVDGGGNRNKNRWQQQEISRDQLLKYKEVRESGGPIAAILQASGLLTFGTGTKWDVEDEELESWLEENIPTRELDLFAIHAGTDAHTYPGVPIEVVENRAGEFSHFECVEPWTVIPQTDDYGDIVGYKQHVKIDGESVIKSKDADELGYIVINRSSGRDKTGVSLLQQNWDEIEHYVDTREATKNSAQLHGFPQRQIRVGREGMSPPNDQELRRIRQRFSRTWDELTMFVTGRDVEIDTLEATDFDFQGLTEDSLKTLMLSFLLPQELANVGSDGLGSGMPADLRKELLMMGIEAKQRDFSAQFVDQLVRPVVEEYSPYDPADINALKFKKPLEDEQDELEALEKKMQIGEKAAKNGLNVRYEAGDIEIEAGEFEVQDEGGELPGGGGGLFSERRDGVNLATPEGVPDNAVGPVQDRDEIPENASVVQGPGGGTYYVPAGGEGEGESDGNDVTADPEEIEDYKPRAVEEGDEIVIQGPDGEEHQVTVEVVGSDNAIVVEDSEGEREVIEPDGETRDGRFEAVGAVGADEATGDIETSSVMQAPDPREVVDAPVSEGGLREVSGDESGRELVESIPTIDKRFGNELEGVPVDPELDLSDEDLEATRGAMSQMAERIKHDELKRDHFQRFSHIHGKSNDRPGTEGHASAGQQIPGEGNEMVQLHVTNPSQNDRVVYHEHAHAFHQSLGYEAGGESAGGNGGFQDYSSPLNDNDDGKPIENALMAHENDTAPPLPDGGTVSEIMQSVEIDEDGRPVQPELSEVSETLNKEVSGTPEEQFRTMVGEMNKAFLKTQGVKEREGETAAGKMVKRPYQMTNVAEFMAVTNETMQKGEGMHVKTMARNHPEMVKAYTSVFDVPEETKEELEWFDGFGGEQ
jgi:hypothetical protein